MIRYLVELTNYFKAFNFNSYYNILISLRLSQGIIAASNRLNILLSLILSAIPNNRARGLARGRNNLTRIYLCRSLLVSSGLALTLRKASF